MKRWVGSWRNHGIIHPGHKRSWVSRAYYSQKSMWCIERLIEADNSLKAAEVHQQVYTITGEAASLTTCRRAMKKLKFRRKVASTISWRRNAEMNREHAEVRAQYHPRCLLFCDEMHKRVS